MRNWGLRIADAVAVLIGLAAIAMGVAMAIAPKHNECPVWPKDGTRAGVRARMAETIFKNCGAPEHYVLFDDNGEPLPPTETRYD